MPKVDELRTKAEAKALADAASADLGSDGGSEDAPSATQAYMDGHLMMPLLECALEALLKEYNHKPNPVANSHLTPLQYLATWLSRNNPKHSEKALDIVTTYKACRPEVDDFYYEAAEERRRALAATQLQAQVRGRTTRRERTEQIEAAKKVQAASRGARQRSQNRQEAAAATRVQAMQRGKQARGGREKKLEEQQEEEAAAVKMQAMQRGNSARRASSKGSEVALTHAAATQGLDLTSDTLLKDHMLVDGVTDEALEAVRQDLSEEELAAVRLQAMQRGNMERKQMQAEKEALEAQEGAATRVQAMHRGNASRRKGGQNPNPEPLEHTPEQEAAATKVQSMHRGARDRRQREVERKAAVLMQAYYQGASVRRSMEADRQAAVKVQALMRGQAARSRPYSATR